jgi:hypothetical protein
VVSVLRKSNCYTVFARESEHLLKPEGICTIVYRIEELESPLSKYRGFGVYLMKKPKTKG